MGKALSFEDSLSKSSLSLSQSSLSSSEKERLEYISSDLGNSPEKIFQRQTSQLSAFSSASSTFSSASEYQDHASETYSVGKQKPSIQEGFSFKPDRSQNHFRDRQDSSSYKGHSNRRSNDHNSGSPYDRKSLGGNGNIKKDKQSRKQRDLIIQDDEEEEYPFAKYTFNKKPKKRDDSSSSVSSSSQFSSSKDSVHSIGLLRQQKHLQKSRMVASRSSTASLMSSTTSSFNESPESRFGSMNSVNDEPDDFQMKQLLLQNPSLLKSFKMLNHDRNRGLIPPSQHDMYQYDSPSVMSSNTEKLLQSFGFDEARSILPERFMKSWVNKVLINQQKEIEQRKLLSNQDLSQSYLEEDASYNDYLPPHLSYVSRQLMQSSVENKTVDSKSNASRIGQRITPKMTFRRSQTFNSSESSHTGLNDGNESIEKEYSKIGGLPLSTENSFDRLKQILQSKDPLEGYKDTSSRRNRFASSRQKSLPIFLETLSEEEEDKNKDAWSKSGYKRRRKYMSNMRSFLDEEDNLSFRQSVSSSEGTSQSDVSRKSSTTNDACIVSESLTSLQNSLSNLSNMEDQTAPFNGESQICLPSILVSENEGFRFEANSTELEETLHISPEQKQVRPRSPRFDNQPNSTEAVLKSKDSLEVAEIMSPKKQKSLHTNIFNVVPQETDKTLLTDYSAAVRRIEKRRSSGSSSHKFLSITSDHDDKYLSPSSSVASPLIMSPITVIEVKNLDNQNDSLELEDSKDTESSQSNNLEKQQQHGQASNQQNPRKECSKNNENIHVKSRKSAGTPKEFSLERRHYKNEIKIDDDTVSDDVFCENSQNVHDVETKDVLLQADDAKLPSLLKLSEVSCLIQDMCSKVPNKISEDLFYIAQDKGVQCSVTEIKEQELVKKYSKIGTQKESKSICAFQPHLNVESQVIHQRNNNAQHTTTDRNVILSFSREKSFDGSDHTGEKYVENVSVFTAPKGTQLDYDECHLQEINKGALKSAALQKFKGKKYDHMSTRDTNINNCKEDINQFRTEVYLCIGREMNNIQKTNDPPVAGYLNSSHCNDETYTMDTYGNSGKNLFKSNTSLKEKPFTTGLIAACLEQSSIKHIGLTANVTAENCCDENDEHAEIKDNGSSTNFSAIHQTNSNQDLQTTGDKISEDYLNVNRGISPMLNTDMINCNEESLVIERNLSEATKGAICNPTDHYKNMKGQDDQCLQKSIQYFHVTSVEQRTVCSVLIHQPACNVVHKSCSSVYQVALKKEKVPVIIPEISIDEYHNKFETTDGYDQTEVSSNYLLESAIFLDNESKELNQRNIQSPFTEANVFEDFVNEDLSNPGERNKHSDVTDAFILSQLSGLNSNGSETTDCPMVKYRTAMDVVLCFNDTNRKMLEVNDQDRKSKLERECICDCNPYIHTNQHTKLKEDLAQPLSNTKANPDTALSRNFLLLSRSLDFDSHGSRKNILLRSHGTTFSKSFDVGFDSLFDDKEKDSYDEEMTMLQTHDNFQHPDFYSSTKTEVKALVRKAFKLNSNDLSSIGNLPEQMCYQERLNIDPNDASYQVGMKPNDDNSRNDTDSSQLFDRKICDWPTEIDYNTDRCVDDINRPTNGLELIGNVSNVSPFKSDILLDTENKLNKTGHRCDITTVLEEFDRLYKFSDDDESVLEEEQLFQFDKELNENIADEYNVEEFLKELDHEIKQMETYNNTFSQIQTHRCKNCGHCLELESDSDIDIIEHCGDVKAKQSVIDHDFCCHCSPLNISTEILERKRLLRKSAFDKHNTSC